ncbi:hypothetical protein IGI04_001244 [Brassica rapa subsp. trilocularis]|uniref:F-box associated beta-propeller type 3 domain-containing protein n=1 Tax=Brassica rapa subsp. trilocularis TaxID=1813537 RepID=A0ABQ7NS52_BRACM|nr:hypothetical protein IGI04_001244 [Brassica rapa subsp. trilocularis]
MDENYILSSSAAESVGIVSVKITQEMVCAFIEFESWSSADKALKKYVLTSWRTLLETGRTQILFYDVRSEKFCLINNDIDIPPGLADHTNFLTLLNYKGESIVTGNKFVEMTSTCELMWSSYLSHDLSNHFHVFFYNLERNTFTRVNTEGFRHHSVRRIHTFIDFVEIGEYEVYYSDLRSYETEDSIHIPV